MLLGWREVAQDSAKQKRNVNHYEDLQDSLDENGVSIYEQQHITSHDRFV